MTSNIPSSFVGFKEFCHGLRKLVNGIALPARALVYVKVTGSERWIPVQPYCSRVVFEQALGGKPGL